MADTEKWASPLSGRYASKEMLNLFSAQTRASTWRQLWVWLAEGQQELGLDISGEAIGQMKAHITLTPEDFAVAAVEEKRRRHDVMAHVHAFGQVAPAAAGFIHYGATSCYVTDNADLIFLRTGLNVLLPKLATVVKKIADFALLYKDLPCLAYTHGQAAQPHTVGKRATLWIKDLLRDLRNISRARDDLEFRGVKGTTGTQASFLAIFDGDHSKVDELDEIVTKKAGFQVACDISSQTYSRKIDLDIANALASFGATCQRIGGDIRHLAMMKEIEEPFETDQIGSSAMAYKRNPMRSERMCSLGRQLGTCSIEAGQTYAAQWFERTLDDSAIRRSTIPEMFLLSDALVTLLDNIYSDLVVYPAVINARLDAELPFMATENIIMALVAKGVSRQDAHEKIRVHSQAAARVIKQEGKPNDLLERIEEDGFFKPVLPELRTKLTNPHTFVGRAPEQVQKFAGPGGPVEKAIEPYRSTMSTARAAQLHV